MPFLSPDERQRVEETAKLQAAATWGITPERAREILGWRVGYVLTRDDRDFLRSIKIRPE